MDRRTVVLRDLCSCDCVLRIMIQNPLAVTKNGCLESTCARSMREGTGGGSSAALHTRACAEYHMWQRSHSTQRVAFGRQLAMAEWPKYDPSTQPKVSKHYRATFERSSLYVLLWVQA